MGAVMVDWLWLLAFFWRLTPRSAACPKGKRVYSPIAGVHVIPIDEGPLYLLSRNSREVSSSLVLYRVRSSTGKGEGVALHGAISGLTRWKELQSICDVSAKQNRGARFARGPTSTTKPFVGGVWARGTPQKAGRPSRPYHGSRAKDDFLADTFGIDKFLTDFRCIDAIWFASIRVPPRDTCIAPVA